MLLSTAIPKRLRRSKRTGRIAAPRLAIFPDISFEAAFGHEKTELRRLHDRPSGLCPQDMRKIKSAGKIVYTTDKSWWVRKGGAFRGNEGQMHEHCAVLVGSGTYSKEIITATGTTTSVNARPTKLLKTQFNAMERCSNQPSHDARAGRSLTLSCCVMNARMEAVISLTVMASHNI